MKSPTIRDAALEARAIAEPLEAKQTEKIERIWENVATIISLLVIELTLALFVYNEGTDRYIIFRQKSCRLI